MPDKPTIKTITFIGQNRPSNRKVKVTLSNGTKITIEPCHESFEQYGGTIEELWITCPLAQKSVRWLTGKTDRQPTI